jgi:hypothetical protein
MNLLEKICLGFLWVIVGSLTIVTMVFTFVVLWQLHPSVAILTFLTTASIVYLTRNSKMIPK